MAPRRFALGARGGLVVALCLPLAFLSVFFFYPLALAIVQSFAPPNWTLAHYQRLVTSPVYFGVVWSTIKIAGLTALFSLLLAFPLAYQIARTTPRVRQIMLTLVVVPFFLSILIKNYAWILLLQRNGVINRGLGSMGLIDGPLDLMYNEFGVLVTMVNIILPYAVFPLVASLQQIPANVIEASYTLGGSPLRTLVHVVIPLSLPGAMAAFLLVFIVSLGFYVTPALVGGPKQMMVSNLIDFHVKEVLNWPFAFSLATVLLIGTLIAYFVYSMIGAGARRAEFGS